MTEAMDRRHVPQVGDLMTIVKHREIQGIYPLEHVTPSGRMVLRVTERYTRTFNADGDERGASSSGWGRAHCRLATQADKDAVKRAEEVGCLQSVKREVWLSMDPELRTTVVTAVRHLQHVIQDQQASDARLSQLKGPKT